jgi:excinuclease ABC subunit A
MVVPDPSLTIREGAIKPWAKKKSTFFFQTLHALEEAYDFDLHTPFRDLKPRVQKLLLYGSGDRKIRFWFDRGRRRHFFHQTFQGVIPTLRKKYEESDSPLSRQEIREYMSTSVCSVCGGARLRPESLAVKVGGLHIGQITALSAKEASEFFDGLSLPPREQEIAWRIVKELKDRLRFLTDVGLDYLTLDRSGATLSGGEGQRIRLATQMGSTLVGVLYILDEPSIGLHQRDNKRLLTTLMKLRDLGNTVMVVEHDRETILSGDYVVDLGPGAGENGGYLVACGSPDEIMANPDSLTGRYLSGEMNIDVPERRRVHNGKFVELTNCSHNNLKNIDVKIPLGLFTCITGVSGSGKSSLLIDILYRALKQKFYRSTEKPGRFGSIRGAENLDKVIDIDQSPIGRTPRSNPATYTGVFSGIRALFSQVPEARTRGYRPGRFSFNVKGGRCEACKGDGTIKIEMHFLPDIYVKCDQCRGSRFNRETLDICYKGKNIADVLDMTVTQALDFFANIPPIERTLKTIHDVGLGYIKLGQAATTLSGGEAQRVKLAKELSKKSTGRTLYILDEPTTGLHFDDIKKLLEVLNRLTDAGNTIIVIEHNIEVIKTADHIIDLGPEGGEEGGRVVACGTPEEVARNNGSYTGRFLRETLFGEGSPPVRMKKASAAAS